jgi:isoamylase
MRDLVTYERKHNEAHGEDNRDGSNDNRSCNYGVEGESDDEELNLLRRRQIRNLLAMMLLATGVPMLVAGRRDGPDPGRGQQRLLPGRRDQLGGLVAAQAP